MIYVARPGVEILRTAALAARARLHVARGRRVVEGEWTLGWSDCFLSRPIPQLALACRPVGRSVGEWCGWLAGRGVEDVGVEALGSRWGPRRAGAARSLVLVTKSSREVVRWRATTLYRTGSSSWVVVYRDAGRVGRRRDESVERAASRLLSTLERARSHLVSKKAGGSPERRAYLLARTEEAVALLSEPNARIRDGGELLPASGYGSVAQRLAAACQVAWVFGGEGSWSDTTAVDREHGIAMALRDSILRALVASVNDPLASAPERSCIDAQAAVGG